MLKSLEANLALCRDLSLWYHHVWFGSQEISYTKKYLIYCDYVMEVSFLITSKNEGEWLKYTVSQLLFDLPEFGEVIVLDDGSTDGSTCFLDQLMDQRVRLIRHSGLGVARARNTAALSAHGRNLIFLDAHMVLPTGWWRQLLQLLRQSSIGAVQPCITDVRERDAKGYGERFQGSDLTLEWLPKRDSSPYPVPILCGCCFAIRRNLFLTLGGLDGGMVGWGSEDCEFSLRLWRLGYQIWITPEIEVAHKFRTSAPYQIDWSVVLHNRLRTAFAHFSAPRIDRIISSLRGLPKFEIAHAAVMQSDIWRLRKWHDRHAVRDDDWFLTHSGLVF